MYLRVVLGVAIFALEGEVDAHGLVDQRLTLGVAKHSLVVEALGGLG